MAVGEQERWGSQMEYLLSCLGYAVGIGNIWRFPYLCYRNGGGAFLIPYFLTLLVCGIPLVYLETTLGQFASAGCISVFNLNPLLKGAGYAAILLNVIAIIYFATIMSYPVLYMYHSMSTPLPWQDCGNPWNTDKCTEIRGNSSIFASNGSITTPEDEFFHIRLLRLTPSINEIGGIVWPVFWCNVLCWIIVYFCICNGVKSVGKIVYFTVLFPYVVLTVLFVRGITLPGAWKGIMFYIIPDWDQLKKPKVWADAATQLFYSLGPGWGGLLSMASFNKFHYRNLRSSIIIPLVNSGTSIWGGFVVFSVLGFVSERAGVPVGEVARAGPGLAYVTYPAAVTMMPAANFWAITFFVMLFFLGIDTMFVTIEAVIAGTLDEFPKLRARKKFITFITCLVLFCLSIICNTEGGLHIVSLLDSHVALACVPTVCALEIFAALYTYGPKRLAADVYFMTGQPLGRVWIILWKYIVPFVLMVIVGYSLREAQGLLGWASALVSVICIPIYAAKLLYTSKGSFMQGGLHIVSLLDSHVALACVPTVCALEIFAALYTYGPKRLAADVYFMTGQPLGRVWIILWKYIVPFVLMVIVGYSLREAQGLLGWASALVSVICIPIYAAKLLYTSKGSFMQRVRENCVPNREWGPVQLDIRQRWEEMKKQKLENSIPHENVDVELK